MTAESVLDWTPLAQALAGGRSLQLFACGNPDRGDDGIGCWIAQQLRPLSGERLTVIEDFQWQIEDALLFDPNTVTLFVDAAVNQTEPVRLQRVDQPAAPGCSSHALSPTQLLGVADSAGLTRPFACFQLTLACGDFSLGAPLSPALQQLGSELSAQLSELL